MTGASFDCPPPDPNPRPARFTPPPGAVDCHCHVFGPLDRFPYWPERSYTPPEAPLADYKAMLAALGLQRSVMVQPSVYGFDNAASLDAMAAMDGDMHGVMVVEADVSDAELQRMHALGARGVRFNVDLKGGVSMDGLEAMAARLAPMGWHIQVFASPESFLAAADRLERLACPVVIDHMGHVPTSRGVNDAAFQRVLRLLALEKVWVKISGAYRISNAAPPYADALPFAKALIAAAPGRCVFGTDWPHPHFDGQMPNDGALLDFLDDAAPNARVRDAILVDNPVRLYGFS